MNAVRELSKQVGVEAACMALGINRITFYRKQKPKILAQSVIISRPKPPLELDDEERDSVLKLIDSERFMDQSPATIHSILLDEGVYLCSVRTMYRILAQEMEVKERRNQRRHPCYVKPELVATGPNQVWSWDITKLKGNVKGTFYHLYVILDIFSRYVVGWMVATVESGELATRLIAASLEKQDIIPGKLTIHSDRGTSMKSKPVTQLMSDLGVVKSHSRPKVSDDNPFSEAQFKTLKYHPEFPARFGSLEDARVFCRDFFTWYNTEHRHSGIVMLTPESVHYGKAAQILEKRRKVLEEAAKKYPHRFKGRKPNPGALPKEVWINPPKPTTSEIGSTYMKISEVVAVDKTELSCWYVENSVCYPNIER
jgi:putative transposase